MRREEHAPRLSGTWETKDDAGNKYYGNLSPGHGAIITGGASGIGLAIASQLARFGMGVCIVNRE